MTTAANSRFAPPYLRTLQRAACAEGIGLHTGKDVRVNLVPREQAGLVFARIDLPGTPEIAAALRNVSHTTHATTLGRGEATVSTTEHLLAALWCNGVSNCRIEIDGPEVPIFDGSALEWQTVLEGAGFRDLPGLRPVYGLRETVEVSHGAASVRGENCEGLQIHIDVEYGREYLEKQIYEAEVSGQVWRDELAPARTFTLEEWIEPLRDQGLIKGGSPDNAVVLYEENTSLPLRFPTELARHKGLDLLGDIALLFGEDGGTINARFTAVRAGHELHRRWMAECLEKNALIRINPA